MFQASRALKRPSLTLAGRSRSFVEGVSEIDPHAWLENVLGDAPLAWVKERNAETLARLGDPSSTSTYKRILGVLDSKDKIPTAFRVGPPGGRLYNFWQDDKHVQGIWRSTTLESYRTATPDWRTAIDLDALPPPSTGTASTWVWHGSTLLDDGDGTCDRALIALSPGGSDADTTREFDLTAERFLEASEGGFAMPVAAKTRIKYRSRDEVLVGTDFEGDGSSLTDSGYPRVVKAWKRGTPLAEAVKVFEGEQTDIAAAQFAYHDRGFEHEFQLRSVTFYTSRYRYRKPANLRLVGAAEDTAPFLDVPIPEDAELETFADAALITLRSDWSPGAVTFPAGSLLSAPLDDVMRSDFSQVEALFSPTASASLSGKTDTKDFLVLKVLEDVRTKLVVLRFVGGKWSVHGGDAAAVPIGEDVDVSSFARCSDSDNLLWLTRGGYLVPDTLEFTDAGSIEKTEPVKAKPAMFDASGLIVEQHFATSLDGTRVPYFTMRRADAPLDGTNATLLDAYGGFEISLLPGYSAGVGVGWLERGGVKVIANIRGGGEYGPTWHQAALKAKRHKAYEDLESVAEDLITRGITSPPRLAVIGGSNGGLLVGNAITRPVSSKLFGAAVCQVPLLDMQRYSHLLAGASWMAEYGNPDTDDWSFLRQHSPYHLLRHTCLGLPEGGCEATPPDSSWTCPRVLFTTSTRDDRVHPGHARKMVKALLDEAPKERVPEVLYWENIEGGHGGAADNKQRAFMWALTYEFLADVLRVSQDAR